MRGTVDATAKRLLHASFNGEDLSAPDALLLIYQAAVIGGHTKVHAFANWAVNTRHTNQYLRRCSIVTVAFNFFGYLQVSPPFPPPPPFTGCVCTPSCGTAHLPSLILTVRASPPQFCSANDMIHNTISDTSWTRSNVLEMAFEPGGVDGSDPPAKVCLPPGHKLIRQLQPYSEYVDFIVRTRAFFLKTFAKHRDEFPGGASAHPLLLLSDAGRGISPI